MDEDKSPKEAAPQAKQQEVTDTRGTVGGPTLHDRQLAGNARQRSTSISGRARFPSSHRSVRPPHRPPVARLRLPPLPARRRPSPSPPPQTLLPLAPAAFAALRPLWPPTAAPRYAAERG